MTDASELVQSLEASPRTRDKRAAALIQSQSDTILRLTEALNTQAAKDVLEERERQKSKEGWSPSHDDEHDVEELASAAALYALPERMRKAGFATGSNVLMAFWPWDFKWWKPKDRRRDLVKSGALILAEIERIDRFMPPRKASAALSEIS